MEEIVPLTFLNSISLNESIVNINSEKKFNALKRKYPQATIRDVRTITQNVTGSGNIFTATGDIVINNDD